MAAAPEDDEDCVEEEDKVNEELGWGVGVAVEVITTTEGVPVPPVDAGLRVMTDVIRTIELVGGGAAAVDGPKEFEGGTNEDVGGAEAVVGGTSEELG